MSHAGSKLHAINHTCRQSKVMPYSLQQLSKRTGQVTNCSLLLQFQLQFQLQLQLQLQLQQTKPTFTRFAMLPLSGQQKSAMREREWEGESVRERARTVRWLSSLYPIFLVVVFVIAVVVLLLLLFLFLCSICCKCRSRQSIQWPHNMHTHTYLQLALSLSCVQPVGSSRCGHLAHCCHWLIANIGSCCFLPPFAAVAAVVDGRVTGTGTGNG